MNKRIFTLLRFLCLFTFTLSVNGLWAQSQTPLDIALRHIEENHKNWELTKDDISDMLITDSHVSSISGVSHIYFKQTHQGIGIENAILNVSIDDNGNVLTAGNRFIVDAATKISTSTPSISQEEALTHALSQLDLPPVASFLVKETRSATEAVYDKGTFANADVIVSLVYVADENDQLSLAWRVLIDPAGDQEYWFNYVDAVSGQQVKKQSLVVKCKHTDLSNHTNHGCTDAAHHSSHSVKETLAKAASVANSYRVFSVPTESPIHGDHVIVTDPADDVASSLGWHDTGATQYTFTRGNNVYSYLDTDGDGAPDGPSPEGGTDLDFDFPFDPTLEPVDVQDAAQVNLFYMNNIMHDFTYYYGFTEDAGNFQANNFGAGGNGNDFVNARAQAAGLNNANFATPPDGSSGTMNMFVWNTNQGAGLLTVDEPNSIAGTYTTGTAEFGPAVSDVPISGEVVIVNDGTYNPYITDGCEEEYINGDELDGKIALVDRGGCFFQLKTYNAEQYGAIAIIICNFEDDPIGMGSGPGVPAVNIPTVMIGSGDCQLIRQFAGNGLEVTLVQPTVTGPEFVDGDFDNGIIAHEYGHGISNRLTGGGSNTDCLFGGEQMGEGWSDFMTLITTAEPGDQATDKRGIGNYAVRLPPDGNGIRNYPYSTDMTISPLTYDDLGGLAVPHGVGEVWCNMLWDLYWAMSDQYGWSEDLYTGTAGNNMAIQLVFEGMKMQPCDPGFVDGRDAILAADVALFNGENQCLIWEVFARRGLGYYADQGESDSNADGTADFEPLPICVPELKLSKTVTKLINAGDNIDVTLNVINHKVDTLTGVTVTDELVDGLTYIVGSSSWNDVTVNGNQLIFNLGNMDYEDEITITYQLATSSDIFSIQTYFDDAEYDDELPYWLVSDVDEGGASFFQIDVNTYAGEKSWFIQDEGVETQDQMMSTPIFSISGNRPALRFFSQYNTESGFDGGLIEISTDGGTVFGQLGDNMIRGAYPGGIAYGTFVIPFLDAFSGDSEGYVGTYIDLSDYIGEENVRFRFHFASDEQTVVGGGWYIDNFELMDLKNYNTTTCATSDQGDLVCVQAKEEGTIIESQISTNTVDPEATVQVGVFPNPTDDQINVTIASEHAQEVTLNLLTLDGKEVMSQAIQTSTHTQTFPLDVAHLPAGFYLVKVATNREIVVEKVVVK